MRPLFSVIIPTYNSSSTIDIAAQSVVKQTLNSWELIIVDDGSSDDTKKVLSHYLQDSRIKYFYKTNGGVSSARNYGINAAIGDFIIFLDSDDELEKNALEVYTSYSGTDYIIGGYCITNRNQIVMPPKRADFLSKTDFLLLYGDFYKKGLTNSTWAKCYRKSLISKLFDEDLSIGEDLVFNMEFLKNVNTIALADKSVYRYTFQSTGSLSSAVPKCGFENINFVYKKMVDFVENNNIQSAIQPIAEKYALDFMVLLERNIKFNTQYNSSNEIKRLMTIYETHRCLIGVRLKKYSWKWELARNMLCTGNIRLFIWFIKFVDLVRGK